ARKRLRTVQTGQESQDADVDSENGRRRRGGARHREERSIPSDDDHQIDGAREKVPRQSVRTSERLGAVGVESNFQAPALEGVLERLGERERGFQGALAGEADAPESRVLQTRSTGPRPLHSGQFTRKPTRNSSLPRAPRMGDGMEPIHSSPSERPKSSASATTRRRTLSERTIPPRPTSARPASNCGFTRTTIAPPFTTRGRTAGRTSRVDGRPGVVRAAAGHRDGAGEDHALRFLARRSETARDEQPVEPDAGHFAIRKSKGLSPTLPDRRRARTLRGRDRFRSAA